MPVHKIAWSKIDWFQTIQLYYQLIFKMFSYLEADITIPVKEKTQWLKAETNIIKECKAIKQSKKIICIQ